jgi:hypothetical protein
MVNLVDEIKAKITEQLKKGLEDAISSTIQNSTIGNVKVSANVENISISAIESKKQ